MVDRRPTPTRRPLRPAHGHPAAPLAAPAAPPTDPTDEPTEDADRAPTDPDPTADAGGDAYPDGRAADHSPAGGTAQPFSLFWRDGDVILTMRGGGEKPCSRPWQRNLGCI